MDGAPFEWLWIITSGVVGSGLNAIATRNRRLLSARIDIGLPAKRLVRPGLLMNLVVGGVASAGCFGLSTGGGLAMAIGFLAARWVTLEADNRLLRFVVFAALGTPAVHPDTVRALETASSEEIYRTVEELMPRRARHP